MQLILSHTSAAARPKLVTYFHFGVRRNHSSRFTAIGNKISRKRVVLYHCFILTEENCLTMITSISWDMGPLYACGLMSTVTSSVGENMSIKTNNSEISPFFPIKMRKFPPISSPWLPSRSILMPGHCTKDQQGAKGRPN